MNKQFETTVTVESHAKYGAFKGTDKKFYKPNNLDEFPIGDTFNVKGYSSESGKTNYITEVVGTTDAPVKPSGRRITKEKAGDDKILYNKRDFVKEAKGKTFSLIVSALCYNNDSPGSIDTDQLLSTADLLLKGIEDRGYF